MSTTQFLAGATVTGVFVIAVLASAASAAPKILQAGDRLPELRGQTLTGRVVVLPVASAGKVTLAVLGFTYSSRKAVEAWAGWYRKTFDAKADAAFFEVPMIGGAAVLARWFINRGMRNGTPPELHDQVITVYEGIGDWKTRLSYSAEHKDDAYLIVYDKAGVVRWVRHAGDDTSSSGELQNVLTTSAEAAVR
jgi:hypothetical protein